MLMSWLARCQRCWRYDESWSECMGIAHAHQELPPPGPPSLEACWSHIKEVYAETQYRYTLGMQRTLDDHRNALYDIFWDMVRHHGYTPESLEHELRERQYDYIWLYAVPHNANDPDSATVCRDPLTRETRTHSVAVLLGTGSEAAVLREQSKGSLSECGFLEAK